ncbi:seipin-1 [Tanacetum coccineum]
MHPPHHHEHHQPNMFTKLISQQSDIISNTLLSLTSPIISLISKKTTDLDTDTTTMEKTSVLFKKAVLGFVGAGYVCLVLMSVMFLSVVLGVCMVRLWVEEPVKIQERMFFDYTQVNPYAVLDLGYVKGGKMEKVVPVGHVFNVRMVFVMPESDYNREIGMFQVIAESLSSNGDLISSSSLPCMLRFRSRPIRLMHTFITGVPLLLGIKNEIQTVNVPLLRYKERQYPRTQSIKISLVPRAGVPFLPQLYEAKLVATSELPWRKNLIRNWKWTFYVWTSLYIYLAFLVVLVSCFRSVMFPSMTTTSGYQRLASSDVYDDEPIRVVSAKDRPTSENLKRWRQARSKRKAMLMGGGLSDATSMSVTRDEDASMSTEEVGDSESVCQ